MSRSALIVDDDDVFRTRLSRAFRARRWAAHEAPDADAALEPVANVNPELILVCIPRRTCLELVADLRARNADAVIIVLTGYGSVATTLAAMRSGANYYLSKPGDLDQILAVYESFVSFSAREWHTSQAPTCAPAQL